MPGGKDTSSDDLEVELADLQNASGTEWSASELATLEEALVKYPADKFTTVERYIQIAALLPNKTARDVALRAKVMQRGAAPATDAAAKRKSAAPSRGSTGTSAKPPTGAATGTNLQTMPSVANGHATHAGPGGFAGDAQAVNASGVTSDMPAAIVQLMEQNYTLLNQFKTNMSQFKVVENTELLIRYRDNLMTIQQHMGSMAGIMAQMPALPVQPNFELATKFLPSAAAVKQAAATPMLPVPMPTFPFAPPAGTAMSMSTAMPAPMLPPLQMDNIFSQTAATAGSIPMPTQPVQQQPQAMTGMPAMPTMSMPGMPNGMVGQPAMTGMPNMQMLGVPPGMMAAAPGGMPMLGAMPGTIPTAMPGAMPTAMPGTMPTGMQTAMPGAMPTGMPGAMPMPVMDTSSQPQQQQQLATMAGFMSRQNSTQLPTAGIKQEA